MEGYLKLGNFCDSIIDVIIIVAEHAVHLNLSIYEEGPDGNLQAIEQTSNSGGRDVHFKFIQDPKNPTHNCYYAIFLYAKSSWVCDHNEDDLGRHIPTREQITTPHEYEILDWTEHFNTPTIQKPVDCHYKDSDLQFPTHLFAWLTPEWVDCLPRDIDGMKIF